MTLSKSEIDALVEYHARELTMPRAAIWDMGPDRSMRHAKRIVVLLERKALDTSKEKAERETLDKLKSKYEVT